MKLFLPYFRISLALFSAAALLVAAESLANSPPTVSNVNASQVSGQGTVRITFDCSDADGDQVTARLICSSNNGASFDLLPVSLTGDVNHQMSAGTGKVIVWNAAADYPGRAWSQVVAKVYVSDGPATSGEMVLVPAGNFTMGSGTYVSGETPAHTVSLDAYYIDKYEVTNAEFKQFIDAGGYSTQAFWSPAGWGWRNSLPSRTSPDYFDAGSPGFPVAGVTYYEAEAYANFVGKRLPTEAEWEKAARGTDGRDYPWGSGLNGAFANYSSSGDPYGGWLTPVGYFNGTLYANPPYQTADAIGPYGTYDQAGNVWEWVRDWYSDYPSGSVSNPIGPPTGAFKILRGGSALSGDCSSGPYYSPGEQLKTTFRLTAQPYSTNVGCIYPFGFRCAKAAQ